MRHAPEQAGRIRAWERVVLDAPGLEFEPARPEFEPAPPRPQGGTCPDAECDGWSTPQVTLRSASVRGERHRHHRRPRQDASCAVLHEGTGTVVFAVADGLSGASASTVGASEACRAAVWAVHAQLDEGGSAPDLVAALRHAAGTLHRQAAAMLRREPGAAEVEELLATTLVIGTAGAGARGVEVSLARVGDSGAWTLDLAGPRFLPLFDLKADDAAAPASVPAAASASAPAAASASAPAAASASAPAAASASAPAAVSASAPAAVSASVAALPGVPERPERWSGTLTTGQVLLVGTDGFGDPLGDGDGRVGALFAEHLAAPPSPLWLAHLLDFSGEAFDGDRTLLALWPRDAA
ncbi:MULTISPECIES: protein phosphatase 2C domain-containing protein [unclassified Nonomuraea]|uniref:protein phosphatase 2C domain-containing protein n=1 Tax=unclassified Nonomuraea TaxID=2593643 RepID=UPI00340A4C22